MNPSWMRILLILALELASLHASANEVTFGTPQAMTLSAGEYWLAWQTDSTGDAAFQFLPALWSASLSGTAVPTPPAIQSQPLNQLIASGATAQFVCQAGGTSPLAYRWYKDNVALTGDTRILGVTSNTLTVLAVQTGDQGLYHCRVANSLGAALTHQAFLNVVPSAPAITSQPLARSVAPGQGATFSVTASGTPPLYYQWKRNGVALFDSGAVTGTQSPTLSIDFASHPLAGTYTCEATNGAGKAVSNGAQLTVTPGTTLSVSEPLTPHPRASGDFGHAIVDLGDVNGDGFADLAVSPNPFSAVAPMKPGKYRGGSNGEH